MRLLILLLCVCLFIAACRDTEPKEDQGAATSPSSQETNETEAGANTAVTPDNSAAPDGEADAIILQMAVYDYDQSSFRSLIESFEEENPGIEIKMVSVEEILGLESGGLGDWPEDSARRLVSAADVIPTTVIGSATVQRELLLDLRPFMEADPDFSRDDFYPNALEYFEFDGGIWALPTHINLALIFYNKDAFDTAGIPYPAAGWAWNDILTAAKATTLRNGEEMTQWGLVHPPISPLEFVLPRSGPVIDASTDPPTPQIDRPDVKEALQWFSDLYFVHEVAPVLAPPEPDAQGAYVPPELELIEDGQAAMWVDWSSSWPWRSEQMNIGTVPFPVDSPDDKTTRLYANGYVLSAGTRHPDAAWRWLDFLSHQRVDNSIGEETAVPARRSIAEASGFWGEIDPELSPALRHALDHSYFMAFTPGYNAFNEAMRAIMLEGQPIEAALAEAQAAAEMEIAAAEANQAQEGNTEEVTVAAPEAAEAPAGTTVIVFAAGNGPGGLQPYRALADSFQEQHPGILVELETPNFGSGVTSLRDVATVSDCLQWLSGVTQEDDRDAILSLEPFLDAEPALNKDDFYPQAIDAFSYQGQLWGLPAEMNVSIILYNKALFDEANLPYPAPGWTTDDFLTIAVALTAGDDPETKQYGYVPQEFEFNDLTAFLERLGAQFLDESTDPPKLAFTHPDTVEAMRWVTNLTTEFSVKPTFMTHAGVFDVEAGEERKTLIENGRAAMWSDQGFQSFPEIYLDHLDIGRVPLPVGPDGTATAGGSLTGYFISAGTAQRQACWEWIKFLSEQPLTGGFGNSVPARRSVAQSAAYAQAVGAELAAVNLSSVENVTGPSVALRFTTDANWLATGFYWWQTYAYDQILTAGVPVAEALAEVQAKADAYRDCIIGQDGFTDDNIQRTCLAQVDETVPTFFIETDDD